MLSTFLAIMGSASANTTPVVSNLAVASVSGGSCTGSHTISTYGTYHLTWTMANADDTNYTMKVYANSLYLATVTSSALAYSITAPGVLDDLGRQMTVDVDYYVQITQNSDSSVVSTSGTVNYTANYGDCSGIE